MEMFYMLVYGFDFVFLKSASLQGKEYKHAN